MSNVFSILLLVALGAFIVVFAVSTVREIVKRKKDNDSNKGGENK